MDINGNGKKSLYDISWITSEENYRADKALSYSTISKFKREGFEHLDTLFDKVESPSLLLFTLRPKNSAASLRPLIPIVE